MVVCITGGAGTGKSYVCNILKSRYGITILDSDSITKSLYRKNGRVLKEIVNIFGKDCLDETGHLNRPRLAEIVFNDKEDLEKLNRLTHPATFDIISKKIKGYKGVKNNLILVESAIAHRSGYTDFCDEFWYVSAPLEERIERLKNSRDYSLEKINSIFNSQDNEEFFEKNCDYVINNSASDSKSLENQLDKLVKRFIK